MLGNHLVNDCVAATMLHFFQQRRAYKRLPYVPEDAEARALNRRWQPDDVGVSLSEAMADLGRNGIAMPYGMEPPIDYASVDIHSLPWIRTAIDRFGHLILGLICPSVWMWPQNTPGLLDIARGRVNSPGGRTMLLTGYHSVRSATSYAAVGWVRAS